jgi:hypothetical protein
MRKLFYFLFSLAISGLMVLVCVLGIDYEKRIQIYLGAPLQAWQQVVLLERIYDVETRPDCTAEIFLNAEIIAFRDAYPTFGRTFFSETMKKHETYNIGILKKIIAYREKYPITDTYYQSCQNDHADSYKKTNAEAWAFIMETVRNQPTSR